MKRLKWYLTFLVLGVLITLGTFFLDVNSGRPFPSAQVPQSTWLLVSGYPLYFLINGFASNAANLPLDGTSSVVEVILGNFAIDVLFWFLLIVMISKAWDLYKKPSKS